MSEAAVVTEPAASVPDGTQANGAVQDNKGDFEARLRQGGDFAIEEVKKAQRELSRLQQKVGKEVEQVVDAVGGKDALMAHLRRLNTLVSDPNMKMVIEQYERTGQLPKTLNGNGKPTASIPTEDDFEEPWTPALREAQQQVEALRAELSSLRGERGVETVRANLAKFREEFPLDDADWADLNQALIQQAQQWGTTAQGLQALKNTSDYTTFRALALGKLTKDQLWKARSREEQLRAGNRAAAATDSPSGVTTQARGDQSAPLSVKDAFIQACKDVGHDPWKPLL